MKIGRPRTLLGLTLTGLGLVTLPLLIGIGNAVIELGRLTEQFETVVARNAAVVLENERLDGLMTEMERRALQFVVTEGQRPNLLELFDEDLASAEQSLAALRALTESNETTRQITGVQAALLSVQIAAHTELSPASREVIERRFRGLRDAAAVVEESMQAESNQRLATVQAQTDDAQRVLGWQVVALVPGTLVLMLFFAILVGRPMRQVDRAIRQLGQGDFSQPIHITGPADIETLGRQLEWLRDRLKGSAEEKNKFLRHMSHELKTPLANIREGTELLLDGAVGGLDPQQQEVTGILRDNGVKLQKLIENLLTFSAWQSKTASLELNDFELKPLVFSTLSQHRLVISNRKLKLDLNVSPVVVRGDEGKIRLVLENLLSNAIKFTPDGGTIHVGARKETDRLVIEVADTGPGVAPEDAGRIFEAFYQGRRLQGGPVGGTGIGLSVVVECAQAHGGAAELVKKSRWAGAHFRVTLPLRRASDRPAMVANG